MPCLVRVPCTSIHEYARATTKRNVRGAAFALRRHPFVWLRSDHKAPRLFSHRSNKFMRERPSAAGGRSEPRFR